MPSGAESAAFAMAVEDIFDITGRGLVVTGRVAVGRVCVGDVVRQFRDDAERGVYTVRWLERAGVCFGAQSAEVGQSVGLYLDGLRDRDDIRGGDLLRD